MIKWYVPDRRIVQYKYIKCAAHYKLRRAVGYACRSCSLSVASVFVVVIVHVAPANKRLSRIPCRPSQAIYRRCRPCGCASQTWTCSGGWPCAVARAATCRKSSCSLQDQRMHRFLFNRPVSYWSKEIQFSIRGATYRRLCRTGSLLDGPCAASHGHSRASPAGGLRVCCRQPFRVEKKKLGAI